jgi:coenzyme Q-binding protein COQ10
MPARISPGSRRPARVSLPDAELRALSVTEISVARRLPFAPQDLHSLVCDVRAYPRFIKWITSLHVSGEKTDGARRTLVASATVGWRALQERFTTRVATDDAALTVTVGLVQGPFKTLHNAWRFESDGAGGAIAHFDIAYEFSNPVLQALARVNRDRMADKIMSAFEAEAIRRFSKKSS